MQGEKGETGVGKPGKPGVPGEYGACQSVCFLVECINTRCVVICPNI